MSQFAVFLDSQGNLTMQAGCVQALHGTTTFFAVGGGTVSRLPGPGGDRSVQRGIADQSSFHGGSGRNVLVSGGPSNPALPKGYFLPAVPDQWTGPMGAAINRDPGTGALALNDGTDDLAGGSGIGGLEGTADAGTFPVLTWTLESIAGDIRTFRGVEDPTILIVHDTNSGNSSIVHDGSFDQIALRAGIDYESAAGVYAASTEGMDDYNGGSAWNYTAADTSTVGTLSSTSYGETTYNGGSPFTLDIEAESDLPAWPNAPVELAPYSGTAQAGYYDPTGWQSWQSRDDPAWTITLDGSGAGEISDGTDVVATRAADASRLYDPGGTWAATAYGETTYNSGNAWAADAARLLATPMEGYLYLVLTVDGSNEVTAVSEPAFAASLPANSSTEKLFIIAYADGAGGITQVQEGPITWIP